MPNLHGLKKNMMNEQEKSRFNDKELNEFKVIIVKKIEKAEEDLSLLREQFANDQNNGTDDTSCLLYTSPSPRDS